jgi:DNA-binding transcriptional regulator LsrR (DeoR family)
VSGSPELPEGRRVRAFPDRNQLLAYVASMYYEGRRSQADIAAEVGLSRSMISRLLDEAHRRGLVEIRIQWPTAPVPDLGRQLAQVFGLRRACVIDASGLPYPAMLRQLGAAADAELHSLLRDGMTISVAWGSALWETVRAVRPGSWEGIEVVQCIGALGSAHSPSDGPAIAQLLAQKLGGRYRYLHAPLVVDSEDVCRGLLADRTIAETLDLAGRADVALVGIGTVDPERSSLRRAGYLSEEAVGELRHRGAVGDICARYFDAAGVPIGAPIDRRVIGIGLDVLREVPTVLGIAGGAVKAESILGALRGRYVDILVTDREAAELLLSGASEEMSRAVLVTEPEAPT